MTNDDFDDIDTPEELEDMPPEKPSFREAWESNPMLKVAAVVLGIVILAGGYMAFAAKNPNLAISMVRLGDSTVAKQVPGKDELDPAYRRALEESNKKSAELAAETGDSALPTPIGTSKMGGLDMPAIPEKTRADPLAEWRKVSENRHVAPPEEEAQAACPPKRCFENAGAADAKGSAGKALYEEAKLRAAKNGTTVEQELAKMTAEKSMLDEAKLRAAKNGTTVEEELGKMAGDSSAASALLDEAKQRAARNGTTVEEELAKMTAEKSILEEAKLRAARNGTTVEQELAKMTAEKSMLEEAKRRAAANGTTVEQELAKMAGEKSILDEAQRRAAKNGTTVEQELAKMAGEKSMLEEAKRRAAKNGTTVEQELAKMAGEKSMLDEAKRLAAKNGTTVEQELAKMAAKDPVAKALYEEAKRRAAANGTTVEQELAKMAAERASVGSMLDEAKRRAAKNGTTVEQELAKMTAERASVGSMLDEAKRRAAKNGTTVEQELAKMAAEKESADALLVEAKRRAAENGTTIEQELARMTAEKGSANSLLDEAKRRAAKNGTTVAQELAKMTADSASAGSMLDEAKRRAAKNGTTVAQELAKMTTGSAAANALLEEAKQRAAKNGTTVEEELSKMTLERAQLDEAKRRMAEETIRQNAAGGAQADLVPMVQPIRPQVQAPKPNPKETQVLADQMRVIVAAQAPSVSHLVVMTARPSAYMEQERQKEATGKGGSAGGAGGAPGSSGSAGVMNIMTGKEENGAAGGADKVVEQTIAPAGSIAYVQLLNELNSDVKGPVLAQILSGPFAGGRAIGKMEVKNGFSEYIVLTFNRVIKDAVSYGVNGIAMDENTTMTGQATDVDHHYFMRVILPAAAKFIEGYGSKIAESGTTVAQTAGGAQATTAPKPSPKESLYKGLEEASKVTSEMLAKGAERPVTIKIAKGTTMGILFIDPVTTKDAGK